MTPFTYVRAGSIAQAIAAAATPGAAYLAAGTNLVDLMKAGVAAPAQLVDLTHIPGLDRIAMAADGSVRIGAMVRNAALATDSAFAAAFPMVVEAMLAGASPQLRNAATIGGNLLQQPRCAYFYDPLSHCNRRRPGAGCDARGAGDNRMHAVLGWSAGCIAVHPSDLAVPLVALDAEVELAGAGGSRMMPLAGLYRLPGDAPERATNLAPGELIVAVHLPAAARGFAGHACYIKVRERTSYAFALVSAAAALRIEDGRIAAARLALGGVAARPWRCAEAEAMLVNGDPGPDLYASVAAAALAGAAASGDNDFKITLARRIVIRALARAAARDAGPLPPLPGSPLAVAKGELVHD